MKSRCVLLSFLLCVGLGAFTFPAMALADDRPTWQYGLSLSYLTGDYGQDSDTDIVYTAATVKRYLDKGDITLTIPYLDLSADGVTVVGGEIEPISSGVSNSLRPTTTNTWGRANSTSREWSSSPVA